MAEFDSFPDDIHPANHEMKRKPSINTTTTSPAEPLSSDDLARLEEMDAPALIALIERMARQCGLVACMSDEEVYKAGMDRMAHLILTLPSDRAKEISTVFDRWADRYKGKPAMTVNQNFTMTLEQLVMQSYKEPVKTIENGVG